MATLAFVLFFVLLAFGVLLAAMSGARKRSARPSDRQGRRQTGLATFGLVAAMVVLGIGVPVAVIAAVKDRDSVPEANVSSLNASEQRGRQLFGDQCRNCHTLAAANSTARVGPNLDDLRPPPSLVLDAIEKGRARGNGQMAADLVEGQEAKDVAAFIAKAVGQTDQGGPVE